MGLTTFHLAMGILGVMAASTVPLMAYLLKRADHPEETLGQTLAFKRFEPKKSGGADGDGGIGNDTGGDGGGD